jgi:hypothetical protein
VEVGVAVHQNSWDRPEFVIQNPIGTYEAGIKKGKITYYYQHISSIPVYEEGYGLNMIGIKIKIK